jgi:predicted dehydrogenase
MGLALQRSDCTVTAISDVDPEAIERSRAMLRDAGAPDPDVYDADEEDFLNLLARDDVDAVIIATPWLWHTPMAVAAMEAGKRVGVEVPAAVTVEECWDLVNTSERTGVPCMVLENVCYRRDVMAVLNMVGRGLFGELVHCHCGYQHDLREVKFQPGVEFGPEARGEARWRTKHSIYRNGELYPTHGIGPIANYLHINYGNRFATLTAMASKSRGLHEYIVAQGGADHPNAKVRFALGDVVTTLIYSLNFRVQGTRGLWMSDNRSVYIEGVSPESHQWEPFARYQESYDHPLWRRHEADATGAGHGGMDFFVIHAFVESAKRQVPPPLDVYAAATWSVISPLSEQSIAKGSEPMEFPDFTRGRWVDRTFRFGVSDEF